MPAREHTYHFVSDVHVANHQAHGGSTVAGLNDRCREVLDVLALAVGRVRTGETLVVLGDLFDSHRVSPQVLAATMSVLHGCSGTVILVAGNHDQATEASSDNALAPFQYLDGVTVVGSRYFDQTLALLPFARQHSKQLGGSWAAPLLGVHLGIADDKTPAWMRGSPDSIRVDKLHTIMREHSVQGVVAGHWHASRGWQLPDNRWIVQLGALCPTGWDNPGDTYGHVARVTVRCGSDGQSHITDTHFSRVATPVFAHAASLDEVRERAAAWAGSVYRQYLRWTVPPGDVAVSRRAVEALRAAEELEKGTGLPHSTVVEVVPDRAAASKAARTAGQMARSASTLTGAVRSYVDGMALPSGVDRAVVRSRVSDYLGVSG